LYGLFLAQFTEGKGKNESKTKRTYLYFEFREKFMEKDGIHLRDRTTAVYYGGQSSVFNKHLKDDN
jgi:hypothetical protein